MLITETTRMLNVTKSLPVFEITLIPSQVAFSFTFSSKIKAGGNAQKENKLAYFLQFYRTFLDWKLCRLLGFWSVTLRLIASILRANWTWFSRRLLKFGRSAKSVSGLLVRSGIRHNRRLAGKTRTYFKNNLVGDKRRSFWLKSSNNNNTTTTTAPVSYRQLKLTK